MSRTALVFGALGQSGSYLCEQLLRRGYHVVGTTRRLRWTDTDIATVWAARRSYEAYPTRFSILSGIHRPDQVNEHIEFEEVYNMAGENYVPESWQRPGDYVRANALFVVQILDWLKKTNPSARFFNSGSAEVFAPIDVETASVVFGINEKYPRKPRSPYGLSKLAAEEAVRIYRDAGLFACTGIFFNMESNRRAAKFFARKTIIEAVSLAYKIRNNQPWRKITYDFHLENYRDWGFTGDYVDAAHRMLQLKTPQDFVIATGEMYSCKAFVAEALAAAFDKVFGAHQASAAELLHEYVQAPSRQRDESVSHMLGDPRAIQVATDWPCINARDLVKKLVVEEAEGADFKG